MVPRVRTCAAGVLLGCWFPLIAQAAEDVWASAASSHWENLGAGSPWVDGTPPGPLDTATLDKAGAYTVSLGVTPAPFQKLSITDGDVKFVGVGGVRTLGVTSAVGDQVVYLSGPSTTLTLGTTGGPASDAVDLKLGNELYVENGATLIAQYGSDVAAGELPSTVGMNGTIRIDGAGSTLTLNQGGSENVGRGGSGAIYLQNGSTGNSIRGPLGLADSSNSTGLLSMTQGSTLTLTSNLTLATQTSSRQSAALNVNGLNSSLTQLHAGTITIGSATSGSGSAAINVGTDTTGGTFNTGTGQITINRTGTVTVGAGANVGTFNANGQVSISGGKLVIGAGSVFNLSSQNHLTSGGQGTIQGSGTIKGYVYNGGIISPGYAIGTLVIDGDFNQSQAGEIAIELGGTSSGYYDQLDVTGHATFGSKLRLLLAGGFKPSQGDSFHILDWGQRSGKFASLQFPSFGNAPLA